MRKTKFFALILAWMMLATAVVIPAYATVDGPSDANGQWTFDDTAWATENYTVPNKLTSIARSQSNNTDNIVWVNPDTTSPYADWAVAIDYHFDLKAGADVRPRATIVMASGAKFMYDFQFRNGNRTDSTVERVRFAMQYNGTSVKWNISDNLATLNSSGAKTDVWSNNLSSEIQAKVQDNTDYRVTLSYVNGTFTARVSFADGGEKGDFFVLTSAAECGYAFEQDRVRDITITTSNSSNTDSNGNSCIGTFSVTDVLLGSTEANVASGFYYSNFTFLNGNNIWRVNYSDTNTVSVGSGIVDDLRDSSKKATYTPTLAGTTGGYSFSYDIDFLDHPENVLVDTTFVVSGATMKIAVAKRELGNVWQHLAQVYVNNERLLDKWSKNTDSINGYGEKATVTVSHTYASGLIHINIAFSGGTLASPYVLDQDIALSNETVAAQVNLAAGKFDAIPVFSFFRRDNNYLGAYAIDNTSFSYTAKPDFRLYGYQKSAITDGKLNLRFVGVLDDLDFEGVGFEISADYGAGEPKLFDHTGTTVYNTLNAYAGGAMITYDADDLDGNYIYALIIEDVPAVDIVFTVKPFVVRNGEKVYMAQQIVNFTVAI